uniref:Uncharacterized protein n=1 Tax=Setaria italica TaxID=4555 RepID=K3Y0T4_SETIT
MPYNKNVIQNFRNILTEIIFSTHHRKTRNSGNSDEISSKMLTLVLLLYMSTPACY